MPDIERDLMILENTASQFCHVHVGVRATTGEIIAVVDEEIGSHRPVAH